MKTSLTILAIILIILAATITAAVYQQIFQEAQTAKTIENSSQAGCIILALDKKIYKQGEPVKITLENKCPYSIQLKNSAPWRISTKSGEIVFTPIALQVITEIKPNESKTWIWNQRDNSGKQVEPGAYQVILETMNSGTLTQSFTIA